METNPTTQEVDDFIRRQEEVERLRSSTAESLVQFYSTKKVIKDFSSVLDRKIWEMWKDTEQESLEE